MHELGNGCLHHQYHLTKEKIETSPTVTEVNMDTFQDAEDIVDADLKIKGQIELSKKEWYFQKILCR